MISRTLRVLVLCVLALASATLHTTFKASIPVKQAAVCAIAEEYPGSSGPALLVRQPTPLTSLL